MPWDFGLLGQSSKQAGRVEVKDLRELGTTEGKALTQHRMEAALGALLQMEAQIFLSFQTEAGYKLSWGVYVCVCDLIWYHFATWIHFHILHDSQDSEHFHYRKDSPFCPLFYFYFLFIFFIQKYFIALENLGRMFIFRSPPHIETNIIKGMSQQ